MSRGEHARYRQLISDRLAGQLSVLEERQLVRHLLACAECRAVHNDYHEQRRKLRSLPPQSPPRDLWARTSVGLDREMARRSWPAAGGPRRVPRAALAGTVAALGVALLVGTSQLGPTPQPQTASGSPRLLLPTPFGVAPQRMAFLGSEAGGMVLYRAEVNQVCPTSALSCLVEEDLSPQVIALPRGVTPSNLSVSPDGERLAITSSQSVVALVLGSELGGPPPDQPPDRPSSEPAATAGLTAAPEGSPPAPEPTADAASPVAPSVSPAAAGSPPAEPSPELTSPELPSSTEPPSITPPVQPTAATAQSLTAVVILDDVHAVGAPPAWASNGELLAFSAMPADASRGPDVYAWREGTETAIRLTNDGMTYFASWSGERIVASRVLLGEADGPATLSTVLIDPHTGLEQVLPIADLWLPQVSPLGDRAVVWQGTMEFSATRARPLTGALYLADWSALELAATEMPTAPPSESTEPPATPEAPAGLPEASPRAQPKVTAPPDRGNPTPDESSTDEVSLESATDEVSPEPSAGAAPPSDAPEAGPGATAPAADWPDFELVDLDPERDPVHEPVLDWQVRWASDGMLLGYWLADAAGASWGHLKVLTIAEEGGRLSPAETLLAPTLARRNFTLGTDRVAWIGPTDTGGDGELRIRTWGPGGEGGLDLPELDLREVVPAF
ncbi:MAG TPA: zf-HC2 domain-containing protein [Candidatus Limnocylindria bacterium]|nr:zf-HC2 domain-containing protein [Candidatus Limnocylindria bacterium]